MIVKGWFDGVHRGLTLFTRSAVLVGRASEHCGQLPGKMVWLD